MKQVLSKKYAELCTKLGDTDYKLKILSDERDQLIAELKALNTLSTSLPDLPLIPNEQTKPNKPTIEQA